MAAGYIYTHKLMEISIEELYPFYVWPQPYIYLRL